MPEDQLEGVVVMAETVLMYKGNEPYVDSRFVAQPGDKVEFSEADAELKLQQEPELWERWKEVKTKLSKGSDE